MGDGAYDADMAASVYEARVRGAELLARLKEETPAMSDTITVEGLKMRKSRAQAAPKGTTVICPVCRTDFVKNHPKQAFCNKDGKHRCKTRFHNMATPARLERTHQYLTRPEKY